MSIKNFFEGKNILITGGSGFLGKALIEKLLRSCGVGNIYILLRRKKGKAPEERLKIITDNCLFDIVKKKKPEVLKKLIPIAGDVRELELGLSIEDKQIIIEKVNIIYHAAASVRFDDFLKDAILLNTRGTRETVQLALQVKNLEAFVNISTTYCNTDKEVIEEQMYPPHADWRRFIELAEEADKHTLDVLTLKCIAPLPNTYTFSKSLSEHVVDDLCKGELPAVIIRPSVVVSSLTDPFPGWIDNFNGPIGLLAGGAVGIAKVGYFNPDKRADYIPVDVVIRMILLATRERSVNKDLNDILVYNAACGDDIKCTNQDLMDFGPDALWIAPCRLSVWYPSGTITSNWYLYYIGFLLYQMLPAILIEPFLKMAGNKIKPTKIQRKLHIAYTALAYFTHNSWSFVNDKLRALSFAVIECERDEFSYRHLLPLQKQDLFYFMLNARLTGFKILLKEEFDRDIAFRRTMILWLLDRLLHYTIFGIGCWYLFIKFDIIGAMNNKFYDYLLYWKNL